MRYRFRWFHPLALALIAMMTFSVQRLLRADPPTSPGPKDVAKATRTSAPPAGATDERDRPPPPGTISGYAVIEPSQPETQVGAAVPGRIAKVAVVEGQHVAAGDVLIELDASIETAALAASEADVLAAQAQLARAIRGSRSEDIKAAQADAETAKARAALSKGIADRTGSVAAVGGATTDEVERARRQADADESAARAADARRAGVLAGSRAEDIQLARAQVLAAQARRDQAKAARERLTVRAPIAAEILQVKVRAGEYYQPGAGLLVVLGDTSQLTARMDVDERDVGRVAAGDAVVIRADAFPDVEFAGTVRELGRRMGRKNVRSDDPAQRNDTKILEVVVAIAQPRGLIVGQRVTCYVAGKVTATR
jgi:HlyD family secretion protein